MKKLKRRALQILSELEKQKTLYKELDEITEKLRKSKFKSDESLVLVDNFRGVNIAFRTTSVKRFELKKI